MCTNARELSNCHGIRMLAIIVHARLSIRSRKNVRRIMAPSDNPLPRRINNPDWYPGLSIHCIQSKIQIEFFNILFL